MADGEKTKERPRMMLGYWTGDGGQQQVWRREPGNVANDDIERANLPKVGRRPMEVEKVQ